MAAPDKNTKGNLTQEELYREIVEYREMNNICTLAFAYHDVPRPTPVEYRNDGATLYVESEGLSHQHYQAGEKAKVVE
jgi:nitroimidazol reductase NimA-like FMN-containing flavoprotein (pyridoxamine 5'-phosphate oxidase superfamily)